MRARYGTLALRYYREIACGLQGINKVRVQLERIPIVCPEDVLTRDCIDVAIRHAALLRDDEIGIERPWGWVPPDALYEELYALECAVFDHLPPLPPRPSFVLGNTNSLRFVSDDFQARLSAAMAIVQRALSMSRTPHIAFSSGKDSLAVMAIVHAVDPNVPFVWSDDELEYPETVAYMTRMRAVAGNLLTITLGYSQHAGWFDPWRDHPFWRDPFPGSLHIGCRIEDWQAQYHDLTFLGLRKSESKGRERWLTKVGPIYHSKEGDRRCNPIMDWTEDDVWALITGWHLPYNTAYDVLERAGVRRERQRVGPLPLTPRPILSEGWPDLLDQLEDRYGLRWI